MGTIDLKSLVTVRPDVIAPARRGKLEYVNNGYEPPVRISCEGATNDTGFVRFFGSFRLFVDGVEIPLINAGGVKAWFVESEDFSLTYEDDEDTDKNTKVSIANNTNTNKRVEILGLDSDNLVDISGATNPTLHAGININFCLAPKLPDCNATSSFFDSGLLNATSQTDDAASWDMYYEFNGLLNEWSAIYASGTSYRQMLIDFFNHVNSNHQVIGYPVFNTSPSGGEAAFLAWFNPLTTGANDTIYAASPAIPPSENVATTIKFIRSDRTEFDVWVSIQAALEIHSCDVVYWPGV